MLNAFCFRLVMILARIFRRQGGYRAGLTIAHGSSVTVQCENPANNLPVQMGKWKTCKNATNHLKITKIPFIMQFVLWAVWHRKPFNAAPVHDGLAKNIWVKLSLSARIRTSPDF